MPDEPTTSKATESDPGFDSAGVPTFESVRDKIEGRYATAQGAAELDAETAEGRSVEVQYEEHQRAAAERLARIRESMHSEES
jgi:phage shock protein A